MPLHVEHQCKDYEHHEDAGLGYADDAPCGFVEGLVFGRRLGGWSRCFHVHHNVHGGDDTVLSAGKPAQQRRHAGIGCPEHGFRHGRHFFFFF